MTRGVPRALLPGAVALCWGLVVSVGAYAAMRAVQAVVSPEPDPAAIAWSVHAGFFWRIATVAYGGGMAAFIALLVARAHLGALVRALPAALGLAAAALALQALLLP